MGRRGHELGGPTVPSGRSGRAATRSRTIRIQKPNDVPDACNLAFGPNFQLSAYGGGFLSLRDPAGATHAAGPPMSSSFRQ